MKPKKTDRANLENKRGIFLQIGLLISLSLVIAAFEWSSVPGINTFSEETSHLDFDEEQADVTREEIVKPPPPSIPEIPEFLNIVEDLDPFKDEFLGTEVEPGPGYVMPPPILPPEEEEVETIPQFQTTEQPDFQGGGLEGFRNWCFSNIRYPEIAAENGIEGKIIVQFTVNHRGKVQDIIIMRGADPALDKEAVRVIASSPEWTPGKRGIKTVNVIFTMPISFMLR